MNPQVATTASAHSEPIVFPPVIPIAGFATGVLLQKLQPIDDLVAPSIRGEVRAVGALVFVLGLAGFAWMVRTFRAAKTPVHNAKTPTALVEAGPFRFTRNPMYLFGATAYAGMAMLQLQLWALAFLPMVQLLMHYGVVLREEAFLERHFSDAYRRYQERVPRWL